MAVMAGPPQRTSLGAGSAQYCEGELHHSGCLESSMREIAVIPARDRKHPHKIECDCDRHSGPARSHPDDAQAHRVDCDEWDASDPVHLGDAVGFHVLEAGPGIEPSQHRKPQVLRLGREKSKYVGHSDYLQINPGIPPGTHSAAESQ